MGWVPIFPHSQFIYAVINQYNQTHKLAGLIVCKLCMHPKLVVSVSAAKLVPHLSLSYSFVCVCVCVSLLCPFHVCFIRPSVMSKPIEYCLAKWCVRFRYCKAPWLGLVVCIGSCLRNGLEPVWHTLLFETEWHLLPLVVEYESCIRKTLNVITTETDCVWETDCVHVLSFAPNKTPLIAYVKMQGLVHCGNQWNTEYWSLLVCVHTSILFAPALVF